jgi:hypothetical protein
MFLNYSTCFGRHTAHHQELKNCNCSLWFYIRFWLPVATAMADPFEPTFQRRTCFEIKLSWSTETVYLLLQSYKISSYVTLVKDRWFLLYCSNSRTLLHYTTIKSQTKTFKFAPTCFGLIWNHLQWAHSCTLLGYWTGMLIYICYKQCLSVAVLDNSFCNIKSSH